MVYNYIYYFNILKTDFKVICEAYKNSYDRTDIKIISLHRLEIEMVVIPKIVNEINENILNYVWVECQLTEWLEDIIYDNIDFYDVYSEIHLQELIEPYPNMKK